MINKVDQGTFLLIVQRQATRARIRGITRGAGPRENPGHNTRRRPQVALRSACRAAASRARENTASEVNGVRQGIKKNPKSESESRR